jgi:hypothetical protein
MIIASIFNQSSQSYGFFGKEKINFSILVENLTEFQLKKSRFYWKITHRWRRLSSQEDYVELIKTIIDKII